MSDFSQVTRLADDLRKVPEKVIEQMKAATIASGARIQEAARATAVRGPHTKRFPDSIRARTSRSTQSAIEVSVEPTGRAQSKLGAILEFGTATSGPHPALGDALHGETQPWLDRLDTVFGEFL